eukprot:GHVS01070848.1.p1 GENE.GHVS01070848.1~~GHVS01070848.1.p1  ORF type:complete len:121 (+),score=13.88 GHVS01070848.1:26-364(+)
MDPDEVDNLTKLPLSARAVFFINVKKELRSTILYPANAGRSFDEILRVLHSLQLTERHPVATPEGWRPGRECMILPSLDEAKANHALVKGFREEELPSGKRYMIYGSDPIGA